MGFPRQEYWSGLHFLLLGIFFPTQGWNPHLPCLLHLQADSLQLSHPGSPYYIYSLPLKEESWTQPGTCMGKYILAYWPHKILNGHHPLLKMEVTRLRVPAAQSLTLDLMAPLKRSLNMTQTRTKLHLTHSNNMTWLKGGGRGTHLGLWLKKKHHHLHHFPGFPSLFKNIVCIGTFVPVDHTDQCFSPVCTHFEGWRAGKQLIKGPVGSHQSFSHVNVSKRPVPIKNLAQVLAPSNAISKRKQVLMYRSVPQPVSYRRTQHFLKWLPVAHVRLILVITSDHLFW